MCQFLLGSSQSFFEPTSWFPCMMNFKLAFVGFKRIVTSCSYVDSKIANALVNVYKVPIELEEIHEEKSKTEFIPRNEILKASQNQNPD